MSDPATVVAEVGGQAITITEVDAREALIRRGPLGDRLPEPGTTAALGLRRWIVQLLVTEAVVAHEARAAGTPVARAARRLFEQVTADVAVGDEDVRRYYEANRDRYRWPESRRVRHVLLADEATAEWVAARVAAGEDIAGLARAVSADRGTRGRGGDLGELRRGEFAGAVEDAVFSARPGDVAGPVPSEFGWHVLQVEAIRPAGALWFEEVRAEIAADLLAAARGRAFDAWLARCRGTLVTIEPQWVHPGDPSLPDGVHRH